MLPFPPRVFAKEYLAHQSARHHSLSDRRRHTDDGVFRHLSLSRHPIRADAAGGQRRRAGVWRVFELDVFQRRHADLSANPGAALQPARTGGPAQSASRGRLRQMVLGPAARGRDRDRKAETLCAGRFTAADIVDRLCAAARREHRACRDFGPNVAAYWQRLQARDGFKRAVAAENLAGEQQKVARWP